MHLLVEGILRPACRCEGRDFLRSWSTPTTRMEPRRFGTNCEAEEGEHCQPQCSRASGRACRSHCSTPSLYLLLLTGHIGAFRCRTAWGHSIPQQVAPRRCIPIISTFDERVIQNTTRHLPQDSFEPIPSGLSKEACRR